EGLGLRLLEAMRIGVPIVCAKVGSLPEVGNDAVIYFDPNSPGQIAEAIHRCTQEPDLRARLVEAGRQQLRRFSYERTAGQTLAIFEQIRSGTLEPPTLPAFRPLLPHNWLKDGHSRWYFRASSAITNDLT